MLMRDFLNNVSNYDNDAKIILFDNLIEMIFVVNDGVGFEQYTRVGFGSETYDIEDIFSNRFLEKKVIAFRAIGKDEYVVCLERDAE